MERLKRREEMPTDFRIDNSELFKKIVKIIRRCDSEYGNISEHEGAELIMEEIEKLLKGKEER